MNFLGYEAIQLFLLIIEITIKTIILTPFMMFFIVVVLPFSAVFVAIVFKISMYFSGGKI